MARRGKMKQADVGINMTPMIDIVFQLILFFMLASSYAAAEVDVSVKVPQLKRDESRAKVEDPKPPLRVVINMAADEEGDAKRLKYFKIGAVNIGDDLGELDKALRDVQDRARKEDTTAVLILRAHRTLGWQPIKDVMTMARRLDFKDINLAAPIGEWGDALHKKEKG